MSKQTEERLDIELSGRKEGILSMQIQHAIDKSEIVQIGQSRYAAKQDAYADGVTSSHDVNARIGITSWASYDKIKSQMHVIGGYCFAVEGCKDLNQIKPEMIANFLTELCDRDYALSTVQGYASGAEKMAVILDAYCPAAQPRTETWHAAIEQVRPIIATCEDKAQGGRAYDDPRAIIDAMPDERMQLVACMQLDHGLRLGDATKINANNIGADNVYVAENSKNGQDIRVQLTPEEVDRIRGLSDERGLIIVKQSDYRTALHKACDETGQTWTGTHGMRYNYAQNRMETLQGQGYSFERALHIVSEEMGHHRPEITLTYLRK